MRWRPISAGVLSDKGFAPKDTQRRCGPMELPQSTAKVGPDPPWWGVGVHWTGAVLLWGEQPQPMAYFRVKIEEVAPWAASSHCLL